MKTTPAEARSAETGFEEVKHLISFDSETTFTNKHSVPTVAEFIPAKTGDSDKNHPLAVGQHSRCLNRR